jgi:hypothetical protein
MSYYHQNLKETKEAVIKVLETLTSGPIEHRVGCVMVDPLKNFSCSCGLYDALHHAEKLEEFLNKMGA